MTSSSRAASHSSCCDAGGLDNPSEAKKEPVLTDGGGGGEVTALEKDFKTDPFPDKCACDSDKPPLVFDRLGSPDRGCGGGLDRSVREAKSGGRLRSRCGSMTTSFSGEAELGGFAGSAARFEHDLIAKVSCES